MGPLRSSHWLKHPFYRVVMLVGKQQCLGNSAPPRRTTQGGYGSQTTANLNTLDLSAPIIVTFGKIAGEKCKVIYDARSTSSTCVYVYDCGCVYVVSVSLCVCVCASMFKNLWFTKIFVLLCAFYFIKNLKIPIKVINYCDKSG